MQTGPGMKLSFVAIFPYLFCL